MTREEAEAIMELRRRVSHDPQSLTRTLPLRAGRPLFYVTRPNRSLPARYLVVSFFVTEGEGFGCVDDFIFRLLPGPTKHYRWRRGGVKEWDGLVLDTQHQTVNGFLVHDLSPRVFGAVGAMRGYPI